MKDESILHESPIAVIDENWPPDSPTQPSEMQQRLSLESTTVSTSTSSSPPLNRPRETSESSNHGIGSILVANKPRISKYQDVVHQLSNKESQIAAECIEATEEKNHDKRDSPMIVSRPYNVQHSNHVCYWIDICLCCMHVSFILMIPWIRWMPILSGVEI